MAQTIVLQQQGCLFTGQDICKLDATLKCSVCSNQTHHEDHSTHNQNSSIVEDCYYYTEQFDDRYLYLGERGWWR